MADFIARLRAGQPGVGGDDVASVAAGGSGVDRVVAGGGDTAPTRVGALDVWWRGYVANADALAAAAHRAGRPIDGGSMAAVLAFAYERWGATLARHVWGEYAAALLDRATGTLLLTHDELGLVPLYYASTSDGLIFGTDLGDVVARAGVGTLDERYIVQLLVRGTAPSDRTPYTHVRRLLACEHVVWHQGALTRRAHTLAPVEPLRHADERDYDEQFVELLTAGVAAAIPPDVKAWCELSGGLDSSSVLAIAAGRLGRPVEALSLVHPRSTRTDERSWMEIVLAQHPVRWHTLDGDRLPPFGELPDGFVAEPSPQAVMRSASQRRLGERLRALGVQVLTTGGGGDSVLLGDQPGPWFFADLLRSGRLARLWHLCRSWARASPERRPPTYFLLRYALGPTRTPLMALGIEPDGPANTRDDAPGRGDAAQQGDTHDLGSALQMGDGAPWLTRAVRSAAPASAWPPHPALAGVVSIADTIHLADILASAELYAQGGRARALGVAERHPLFYRPLIDFMRAVPWERKLSPTTDRLIQRRALRHDLPAATLARIDKGDPSQVYGDSLAANRGWQRRLTERPLLAQRGYVHGDRWRGAVRAACAGQPVSARHFLAAAAVEIWLQQLDRA